MRSRGTCANRRSVKRQEVEARVPRAMREAELTRLKDDAEARQTKLEALREIRLQVQGVADNKPTVQQVIGRLLRRASNMLRSTVFGVTQQAAFIAELVTIQPWMVLRLPKAVLEGTAEHGPDDVDCARDCSS